MKKLNKIISIISLASATGLPFAISSCSNGLNNDVVMHDLKNNPCDPLPKHPVEYWNQTDTTTNYIEDVKNNYKIFENDACLTAQKWLDVENYDEFSFGVNKPKFGSANIWQYGAEDFIYPTITASQKFHTKQTNWINEGGDREEVLTIDFQVWYDNVVFYAFEDAITNKWCLGLFDYSIGDEAYWPFVSNTEPWSLRYSCKVYKSEYYVNNNQRILINNQNSYYTGVVDNGETLINLCKYYQELEKKKPEEKTIEERRIEMAISIILSDYESSYLSEVKNVPEIRATGVLTSDYHINSPSKDLLLSGLIFIKPTYFEDAWLTNDPSVEKRFVIQVDRDRAKQLTFNHYATEEPPLEINQIFIKKDTEMQYGEKVGDSDFRRYVNVVGMLGQLWKLDPPITPPVNNILFSAIGKAPVITIEMYATNALREERPEIPWTQEKPLTQVLYLGYDYILHNIVNS